MYLIWYKLFVTVLREKSYGDQRQQVRSAQGTDGDAGCGRTQDHHPHPVELPFRSSWRTALHHGDRPGPVVADVMSGEGEEGRRLHHSGAQAVRLCEAAAGRRYHHQATGEP